MLYSLLLSIGGLIIMFFLSVSYFISIKKIDKMILRQKLYIILIILGFVSTIMDILYGVFYSSKLTVLYHIAWKIDWITVYAFYFMLYYYFRYILKLETVNNWKEVFLNYEKKLSTKNIYSVFTILFYIYIIIFVKPPGYEDTFMFMAFDQTPMLAVTILMYLGFIIDIIIKAKKTTKNAEKTKKDIIMIITVISAIGVTTIIQFFIPTYAMLGIGKYLAIMFLFFLVENADMIIADELKVLQKNIEKSSNAKLDFLYNMSHDIRSPMNAIVELSKSLREIDEFDEESIRADIKSIKFSCNNLVEIVNNILDINKIASGNESVQAKEYNLNKLLADLPYVIETRIGSKPIKLEFDIDQNIASKLEGDTTKIYRVIMNILTNSVKYTEVGKIRMIIKGDVTGNIQNLHIKISDTGYGIKKEDYDKMFTKFNRLDDATDNAIEGTGLGLVITKKYVDSMGGKIWFESEYGAGTIFYIDLPQKILDSTPLSQATDTQDNKKIEICDCKNSRVLIVDDNALNIKVTKKILEKYNIEVDTVKTGKDCIFKIKSGQSYDLILLDDMLPDLGGMEVVHVVKNIQGFDIPPVIAYTANVMNGIKEEYLAQGFDDYMPKPLDINQFDGIIKKYCYKQKNGE